MSGTIEADGAPGDGAVVDRLTRLSDRTNLMVLDATLRALSGAEAGHADVAAEIRSLSRRMMQAAQDFQAAATAPEAAEPEPAE